MGRARSSPGMGRASFLSVLLAGALPMLEATPNVVTRGEQFVDTRTGAPVILIGANVVVKGPPWIPSTTCATGGTCKVVNNSFTFTEADARHLRDLGYNLVRLGVVWAGGQPTSEPRLGEDFARRLHDLLSLCDDHGLHVLLDVHQDAVGTAVCGEGVPQWFSALATPGEIGKPLRPGELFKQKDGSCGTNDKSSWAEHAGDPDYNIKNKCCRLLNQGSWGTLAAAEQSKKTMEFLLSPQGRPHYAHYTGLLAAVAKEHQSVFGIELMNEPPTINRAGLFVLWEDCYKAIRAVAPSLAVGVMDPSQVSIGLPDLLLEPRTRAWLKEAQHLFYAWHYYGTPSTVTEAIKNAEGFGKRHSMPSLLTEYGGYGSGCYTQGNTSVAGIGSAYWHYDDYCYPKHCPGGLQDGHCPLNETGRFGACITGWGNGNNSFSCT